MCPFCEKMCSKLTDHIKNCHKEEETVKKLLTMKKSVADEGFQKLKRAGIILYNKKEAVKPETNYQSERKPRKYKGIALCSNCSSFISKRFFASHKKYCIKKLDAVAVPIPLYEHSLIANKKVSKEFATKVLSKLRSDELGKIVRNDDFILFLGQKYYNKNKHKKSKIDTVRKTTRGEMRLLANVYQVITSYQGFVSLHNNIVDLFCRDNFYNLCDAVEDITTSEGSKPGLRQKLFYLIVKSCKKLRDHFFVDKKEDLSNEIQNFLTAVKSSQEMFLSSALYEIEIAKLRKTRKPCMLPLEEDIKLLHVHILERMKFLTDDFTMECATNFIELRNVTMVRLTLFNARRGGEVGRLQLDEWNEADKGGWIDKQRSKELNEADRLFLNSMNIAYQAGKGNKHVVSVLIPEDSFKSLKYLTNIDNRRIAGVADNNCFVFPSTRLSDLPFSGWHALKDVCHDLDLKKPELINATVNRHRISTLYAALDLNEYDRTLFYKHMGHSAEMNKDVYQSPLAIMGITSVGRNLLRIEGNFRVNL